MQYGKSGPGTRLTSLRVELIDRDLFAFSVFPLPCGSVPSVVKTLRFPYPGTTDVNSVYPTLRFLVII